VTIELDYMNPVLTRKGAFFSSTGKLEYSFSGSSVDFTDNEGGTTRIFENPSPDPDKMYLDQMKDFIEFAQRKGNARCSFEDGINVMRVIEVAEKATKERCWQQIEW
jgi:predicted dehydrogenase